MAPFARGACVDTERSSLSRPPGLFCAELRHPSDSSRLREPKAACGTSSKDRFVLAPPPKDPDHRIMATTRTRRTYDPRFRQLIRETRDIRLAIQGGVPRSSP
jgi:hypothetical protein